MRVGVHVMSKRSKIVNEFKKSSLNSELINWEKKKKNKEKKHPKCIALLQVH